MSANTATPMPATLTDLVHRLDQACRTGAREVGAKAGTVATRRYNDPAHWSHEQDMLFGRWPIVAAHSAELPVGSALPFDALGTPIVLTRAADGRARAFLNVCRHRGMALLNAVDQAGRAKSCKALVCPYHAWSYELDGRLRHRLHAETFDGIDASTLDLVALPCDEVSGLVLVTRTPGPTFSASSFLQGLGAHLDWLRLSEMSVFRKVDRVYAANWKLTVDAFLEAHHIRVLHRDTIYPFFGDAFTVNLHAGAHLDSLVARRAAFDAFAWPTDRAALCKLATPTQLLFPNTFLIWHPDDVSLVGMFSPAPDQVRWVHTMLIPPDRTGETWQPHWEKTFALIEQTVSAQRYGGAHRSGSQRQAANGAPPLTRRRHGVEQGRMEVADQSHRRGGQTTRRHDRLHIAAQRHQ